MADDGHCIECGCTPRHEDCGSYCRRCSNKNNSGSRDYTTIIDHDKLREKLGRELAAAVIFECAVGWQDEHR